MSNSIKRFLRVAILAVAGLVAIALVLVLVVYLRLGSGGPELVSADPAVELTERPCDEELRGARCAVVSAPLDHEDPDGETVEVGFAYYPAVGLGADRSVAAQLIGGGPGSPISEAIKDTPMWAIRMQMRDRALLAVDPRGIGWSTRLECEALRGNVYLDDPDVAAECAEQLGPDKIHYSTANTARDFDLVRQALGLEQLDVLGFSYGTNLGAVYAGMFPDAVRTLALDGAYPTTTFEEFTPNYHAAMRRQFHQFCERSGDCEGDDALAALDWAAEELRENPRPLEVSPERLSPDELTLDPSTLASLATGRPALPPEDSEDQLAFHLPVISAVLKARDEDDWSELEALTLDTLTLDKEDYTRQVRAQNALFWSVFCPESTTPWSKSAPPEVRRQQLIEATEEVPPGSFAPFTPIEWASRPDPQNYYPTCINWSAPPADRPTELASEFDDWRPDLPVLVMNGDYDMQTTNEDARRAAAQFDGVRFDRIQFARFKHHGHAILPASTCALGLWTEFMRDESVADPDACLNADALPASIDRATGD